MRRFAVLVVLALAGCGGNAPAVQGPPALGVKAPCDANMPPAGYGGPVSPHGLSCGPVWGTAPAPAGVHDYWQGQPPRAVRGQ